ncbi:MAG: hypothetical protein ABIG96_01400 [Candidatus Micrarchaeota archaeon]
MVEKEKIIDYLKIRINLHTASSQLQSSLAIGAFAVMISSVALFWTIVNDGLLKWIFGLVIIFLFSLYIFGNIRSALAALKEAEDDYLIIGKLYGISKKTLNLFRLK